MTFQQSSNNLRIETQLLCLLKCIVKIREIYIIIVTNTPGIMPLNILCCSNNCAMYRIHVQVNVSAINPSKYRPRLHSRCIKVHSLHNEDGESMSQPPEPSTSQASAVNWAPLGPPPSAKPPPRLVKTQRGIPMVLAPIPEDRCPECNGNGRLTCGACKGKGRLNYRKAAMLPSGVWPEWCPHCRATGKWVCSACMGTGERREPMGFRIE